ncbi:MAG: hypothetical protein MUO30_00985 [Anaerolineales bacterium]|nr:hypothetical protein [Anaerolineales bacterium]
MQQLANNAVNAAKDKFGIRLDFSENSLQQLEILLQQAHEGYKKVPSSGNSLNIPIENTVRVWGSYFGEVFRRSLGGDWIVDQNDVFLQFGSRRLDPLGQVRSRIVDGPLYNVQSFFQGFNPDIQNILKEPMKGPLSDKKLSQTSSIETTTNNRSKIYITGTLGSLIVVCLCILGVWILFRQGVLSLPLISSLLVSPTSFPSPTPSYSATPTLTPTPTPTLTLTPTITFTPTITLTPSHTPTATATATSEPMSALALKAKDVLKARGFVKTSNRDCVLSCQAYVSEVPPMEVAVHNNGLIVITVNDESIVFNNMIKLQDCPIPYGSPYNMEIGCDLNIIDAIYSSASPNISIWVAGIMDGVNSWGHWEVTNSYGFFLQGVASDPHKIIITITPPK